MNEKRYINLSAIQRDLNAMQKQIQFIELVLAKVSSDIDTTDRLIEEFKKQEEIMEGENGW